MASRAGDSSDWTDDEICAIVDDYLEMLARELARTPYNKAAHRRALQKRLPNRSDGSIEFKHQNISAALRDAGSPYIDGYKPMSNYQRRLAEVVVSRLRDNRHLAAIAIADAESPIAVPEIDDWNAVISEAPQMTDVSSRVAEAGRIDFLRPAVDYLEREARNRSLGLAGEQFIIQFERARLIHAGKENLASRIEHTSQVRGDHEGYDILSFEENGAERLIEVKTTKYGIWTPFYATRNEVETSARCASQYHLYRLYKFRAAPKLYTLNGALGQTCQLFAASYVAQPR